ncbi:MAG: rsbU [Eubacterium sp.]|nr:rsbU [Eubacterium sp.]
MLLKSITKNVSEYKKLIWLGITIIFSWLLFQTVYLFEPFFDKVMSPTAYLSWHTIFEFVSILISFCVFILPYYSYRQNRRLRGIVVANTFFIMGIIDIFHALSYKGMTHFLVENNSSNRATTFWIFARLVGALGITAASFIRINKKSQIDRRVFLACSASFSIIVLIIVTYYPGILPAMYIEETGVTQIKKILEYIVILLFFFAGIRYLQQYLKRRENSNLIFVIAITTSIFSELAFVTYTSVFDIYNYLGHVYKFLSYFMVFRVAFVNNIEKPYLALYKAKNKIKADARNLNKLVAERTKDLAQTNQKLLEDLECARDIQKAMLPGKLPNNEQVSFEAKYYPAERVSGDFYNIFRLDEKNIGMYIGDVSGHGVPAAMLTVFLNQSIKTIKELEGNRSEVINPSKVLENLYKLYNKVNFKDDIYILVLYAIYNLETKQLIYSSAGMNAQPLIVKRKGEIMEMDIKGLPICNLADICPADYTDKTIQLENGDKIFFYTDGLIELNNKKTGKVFNIETLKKLLAEPDEIKSFDIYKELDRTINYFTENGGLKDDVTFFTLKVS